MSPDKKDGPRDWDKELAEVDKLIAGLGGQQPAAAPPPVPQRTAPGAAQVLGERRASSARREALRTWLWFVLAAGLGTALTWFWPYAVDCDIPLYGFLAAGFIFLVASAWSTIQSWRTHSTIPHFLSIAMLFWAAWLGGREVLPRIGYA